MSTKSISEYFNAQGGWDPGWTSLKPSQSVSICAPLLSQAAVPGKLSLWTSVRIVVPCEQLWWISPFTLPQKQGKIHKHLTPIWSLQNRGLSLEVLSVWALLLPSCNLPSPLSCWHVVTFSSHGNRWSLGIFLWPPSWRIWSSILRNVLLDCCFGAQAFEMQCRSSKATKAHTSEAEKMQTLSLVGTSSPSMGES